EVKWDGYRALAVKDGSRVQLLSRQQKDLTRRLARVILQRCLAKIALESPPLNQQAHKRSPMLRRWTIPAYLTLASFTLVPLLAFAQTADPWLGTWKLNLAKSSYSPGPAPKGSILRIEGL